MSEIVYAAARREVSPLDPEKYRMLDGYLRTLGAFTVVFTTANQAALYDRFKKRADVEMYEFDLIWEVNRSYRKIVANGGRWDHYAVDFDMEIVIDKWPSITDVRNVVYAYVTRFKKMEELRREHRPKGACW